MSAPQAVLTLLENFERNLDAYQNGQYNETQVRRDFIDPLFKALGWDMDNSLGYAEAYRDVIHEDAIKVGGSTRAPDYSFRIGGTRKFFLEAKKPSVNLKDDIEPAFQLRRYGWSAKLPVSVLTDFEEFAVYDCRDKPDKNDKASKSRLFYCTFRDYPEKWDEIAAIFSKDAVLKGSFDKFAISIKGKRGSSEVDGAFLEEIEGWRDLLARNIALRNDNLSQRELNFAVQQTIDRIIFLRICEDRGIEPYGKLRGLQNGVNIYDRLVNIFHAADNRYNSGLFHFKREKGRTEAPDELTLNLQIDDKPLREIFKNLYYPDCPYEFSVLGADILGSVYEQFLGKVIRLTSGNRATVEDKPAVKKAGGVFYTPSYIVQYIVQHTVGALFEGKTAKQAEGIRILDPACGSGSFLLGAYQKLLDWYLALYQKDPEKFSKGRAARIRPGVQNTWRLTTAEKKRILLEHIYGVDIDAQAVEVTKLSLLLKMLEGESDESLSSQMKLFHERALPDLEHNIQCGNSLIGSDFYDSQLDLDDEATQRINVFNWETAFPHVFKVGGFDAVIGNPPWGGDIDDITKYIEKKFPDSTHGYKDTFKLFIDQGLRLTKADGLFSMIIPSAFMFQPRYIDVRRLLRRKSLIIIWNIGDGVFGKKVVAPSCVFVARNADPKPGSPIQILDTQYTNDNALREKVSHNPTYRTLVQSTYERTTEETFVTFHRPLRQNETQLGEVLDCKDCGIKHQRVGVGMEQKGKSDLADRLYYEGDKETPADRRYLIGSDLKSSGWHMDFSNERYFRGNYKKILRDNEIVYFNQEIFDLPEKIVWRQTSDRIRATIIGAHWFGNTLQAGVLLDHRYDLRYVLGLLNSKFLNFIYLETVKEGGRVFPQVKMGKVRALPFRKIDFTNDSDKAMHDRLVTLVDKMLALHKQVANAKTPQDTTLLQRHIAATEQQMDRVVYSLYGLSEQEILIMDGHNDASM